MKEKEKKNRYMAWGIHGGAFLLPVIVMIFVLKAGGFYPFGDRSALIMDMRDQYVEFFASIRQALHGENSFFYSWSRSMGGNYIGLFAYYISSPLSIITLFFSIEKLPLAMDVLLVLKIGLAGLSFSFYGKHMEKKIGSSTGLFLLLPSVCYALISYNMVYSLSVMWLDAVVLLPLLLMGIECILEGSKGVGYACLVAFALIANYYTGYMLLLFCAIYVCYRLLVLMAKDRIKELAGKGLRILGMTVLGVGISAPLLFSVMKDLLQGKLAAENVNYTTQESTSFVFSQFFGKFGNGVYDSITNNGLPAVYCGYLMLGLAVVFLVVPSIKIREKLGAVAILAILTLSFYYVDLDKIWHGFQYPNWFPYRYAFLFSFFVIYMAWTAFCHLANSKFYVDVLGKNAFVRPVIAGILLVTVLFEMGKNGVALMEGLNGEFGYKSQSEYEQFLGKTKPLVEQIKEQDNGFYRINQGFEYSKNDAMLLGYNGMTHYSSTFNAAINRLTPSLGIAQTYFWNSGYGSNFMLDSLFAVKYIMADRYVPNTYTWINSTEYGSSSYSNPYALSIAYSAPASNLAPYVSDADPFTNQNAFLNGITDGAQDYFVDCGPYFEQQSGHQWSYSFVAAADAPAYLYMRANGTSWANVYVNDVWVGNYFSSETNGTLFLGDFTAGQEVHVRVEASEGENVELWYGRIVQLNKNAAIETLSNLQGKGMTVTKHACGKLEGTIQVAAGERVMTSIPYDTGWKIYVDGKKVSYEKYADTFLTFACDEGEHKIRMEYVSPGFGTGVGIAVVSVLALLIYGFWEQIQKKWKK